MTTEGMALDHLERFLRQWYGDPDTEPKAVRGAAPEGLRRWYGFVEGWGRPLAHQNTVLAEEALTVEGDKTLFYVENQGVWLWSYGPGDNPEVFDRENEPGAGWSSTGEALDTFLWHMGVFEAVMFGPHTVSANDEPAAVIQRCTAMLEPFPFRPWRWPGPESRLWFGSDLIAMTGVNDRPDAPVTEVSDWYLFAAGRSADALSIFDDAGIDWDFDSRWSAD